MKTATARAVEAIEAAEKIFAGEMGATLDLSPAAKTALIATITAAIKTAIAEERQKLTGADDGDQMGQGKICFDDQHSVTVKGTGQN